MNVMSTIENAMTWLAEVGGHVEMRHLPDLKSFYVIFYNEKGTPFHWIHNISPEFYWFKLEPVLKGANRYPNPRTKYPWS